MPDDGIIVVGAGPAGAAAAVQCARLGEHPVVLDRTGRAGGLVANGYRVENYPGLERPLRGEELADRIAAHLSRFGLEVREETVLGVEDHDDGGFFVRSDRGRQRAAAVFLCTGTEPRRLSVPGPEPTAPGALFSEVRELLAALPRPKRVIVVGGGEAAFDSSLSLAGAGAEVRVLIRGDRPRARGCLPKAVRRLPSIRLETGTVLRALSRREGVLSAETEGPEGLRRETVDAVLAAVGRVSAVTDLVEGAAETSGRLPLTPRPGLYVCGDARARSLGQVGIAVGDGLAAAAHAVHHVRGGAA